MHWGWKGLKLLHIMWVSVENMRGTLVRLYCCLQIWMKYCKGIATDWLKQLLIYRYFIEAWDLKLAWVPTQGKTSWFPAVIEIASLMHLACNHHHHHHSMPLSCRVLSADRNIKPKLGLQEYTLSSKKGSQWETHMLFEIRFWALQDNDHCFLCTCSKHSKIWL